MLVLLHRTLLVAGLWALMTLTTSSSAWGQMMPKTEEAARLVMEKFCQAEFVLDAKLRFELLKFTPGGESEELHAAGHGMKPGVVIDPDAEQMAVVTSYVVKEVKVTNDRASAIVEYRTVARRGHGGILARLTPHLVERDQVPIQLQYTNGRWWILDPPLLRGSLPAMIESYKNLLTEYEARFKQYPETFGRDKTQYFIAQDNLKFLQSLK